MIRLVIQRSSANGNRSNRQSDAWASSTTSVMQGRIMDKHAVVSCTSSILDPVYGMGCIVRPHYGVGSVLANCPNRFEFVVGNRQIGYSDGVSLSMQTLRNATYV